MSTSADFTNNVENTWNVDFVEKTPFWGFYLTLILATRVFVHLASVELTGSDALGWTVTSVLHGMATYVMLHWNKGTASHFDQGSYSALTFWEQIDAGVQYTRTRKFFQLVPIVIYLLASYESQWSGRTLFLNTFILGILLIAKLPQMYRVRIFGINK